MKKWLSLLFILIIIIFLTGCNNKKLNDLETEIRKYDYYSEIVEFEELVQYGSSLKLFAAYNDGSNEIYYIYQVDHIYSDYEVLIKTNDIIHESFIIAMDNRGGHHLVTVKASDLNLEQEVQKGEIRLITPGFHKSETVGVRFLHQFNLIKSTKDLSLLNREFKDASDYKEQGIKTSEDYEHDVKSKQILITTVVLAIIIYLIILKLYKLLYQKTIDDALKHDSAKIKLMDINPFKYILAIIISVTSIILFFIIMNGQTNKINQENVYIEGYVPQEEMTGNYLNLKLAYSQNFNEDYNTAYLEKLHGNYMGSMHIYFDHDESYQTLVGGASYGAYEYKVIFRNITCDTMHIKAYEDYGGDVVYTRMVRLNRWRKN